MKFWELFYVILGTALWNMVNCFKECGELFYGIWGTVLWNRVNCLWNNYGELFYGLGHLNRSLAL